jgi:hypothetical protein
MLKIPLEQLTVPPEQALAELRPLYEALRSAAMRENDLRTFLSAEVTLLTLTFAESMLEHRASLRHPPFYLKAEAHDPLEDLYWYLKDYVTWFAPARMPVG